MANKPKKLDVMSSAAMETISVERKQEELAKLQLKKREVTTAFLFEEIGKVKAMNFSRAQAEFMTLVLLKRLKDHNAYRELDMTWEQTCDFCGMKRRTVDEKLVDLKPFKADFLGGFAAFAGFDFNKIKMLGEEVSAGSAEIRGNTIFYGDHKIALLPENKDEVQDLLHKIETDYQTKLDDAQGEARASKRVLKDKETLINKQAKLLDRYTGKARNRDLSPEEDGFLAQMDNLRIGFDGYMLGAEPQRIEELQAPSPTSPTGGEATSVVTPRMRAAYLETLGYMRRQITAAHDTAVEMYGHDMALEGEAWKPGK